MGHLQTPICKWGKRPITVMGVAEHSGLYLNIENHCHIQCGTAHYTPFASVCSKMSFFKRAWQVLKVLPGF